MSSLAYRAYRRLLSHGAQSARQIAAALRVSHPAAVSALRRLARIGAARNTQRFGTEGVYVALPADVAPEGRGSSPASRANLELGPTGARRARGRRQRIADDERLADERIRPRDGYGYGRIALEDVWIARGVV